MKNYIYLINLLFFLTYTNTIKLCSKNRVNIPKKQNSTKTSIMLI